MAILQDVKFSLRGFRKRPGFTAAIVLTLALGIGANAAVFSVIYALLIRPLPYPEPQRLVKLYEAKGPNDSGSLSSLAPGNFLDWQEQNHSFTSISAASSFHYNITSGVPEHVQGGAVSASLFATFGIQPALGRAFLESEDRPNAPHVVILSDPLWRRRFGADTGIIGKTVAINGDSYTVLGVMPPGWDYPGNVELSLFSARYCRNGCAGATCGSSTLWAACDRE